MRIWIVAAAACLAGPAIASDFDYGNGYAHRGGWHAGYGHWHRQGYTYIAPNLAVRPGEPGYSAGKPVFVYRAPVYGYRGGHYHSSYDYDYGGGRRHRHHGH